MPIACADFRSSAPRNAYTLLEVILVLAILAAIAAIVTPSVGEAFLRQKLNSAADQLRNEWDKARLAAMKTGQIQAFNCTAGERTYTITPYMTGDDTNNASTGATVMTAAGMVGQATSTGQSDDTNHLFLHRFAPLCLKRFLLSAVQLAAICGPCRSLLRKVAWSVYSR